MLAPNPCLYREGSTICPLRNSLRNVGKIQTPFVEVQKGDRGEGIPYIYLCNNLLVRVCDQEVDSIGSIHISQSIWFTSHILFPVSELNVIAIRW